MENFFVVTPVVRTSFLNIFTPKVWEGDTEGDYQATLLFDKESEVAGVQEAVLKALAAEFGDNVPGNLEMPWKKGEDHVDGKGNVREGYEGKIVIRAKSKYQPTIIDQQLKQIEALDADSFQSGDYARAKLEAKVWEYAGKRGVSLYLKSIQKIKTGERFGGEADLTGFEAVEVEAQSTQGDLF